MNTFCWLLLGHLLGDWLLQNDWLATGKRRGLLTLAGLAHFAIYSGAVVGALWLSGLRGREPAFYMVCAAIVFVSHWLIDATDGAGRWMRLFRQSRLEVVRVMVDQVLHLLVLAGLAVALGGG
jgi:hypothetical protein